jgi:hypothetical protein
MSANKLISKIFLPRHCIKAQSGYIVGWNVRSFVTCVATIISDIEVTKSHSTNLTSCKLSELDKILSSLSEHEEIRNSPCGPPVVLGKKTRLLSSLLGEWLVNEEKTQESSKSEEEDVDTKKSLTNNKVNEGIQFLILNLLLRIHMDHDGAGPISFPQVNISSNALLKNHREIYCYGYRYQTSAQIVVYSQPTSQHFFWPEAIHLDPKYKEISQKTRSEDLTELEEALQQVTMVTR